MKIIGIGGAGMNSLNSMIDLGMTGVELIAVNTDAATLETSKIEKKIQIGKNLTNGFGSNGDPDIGRESAILDKNIIMGTLQGSKIVFITIGLGGGTGTGAAPVIAKIAKESGAYIIAVVTKPFSFEGIVRRTNAEQGLWELENIIDIVIPLENDKLRQKISDNSTLKELFLKGNEVLFRAINCVKSLINEQGLDNINYDKIQKELVKNDLRAYCVTDRYFFPKHYINFKEL